MALARGKIDLAAFLWTRSSAIGPSQTRVKREILRRAGRGVHRGRMAGLVHEQAEPTEAPKVRFGR